MDFRPINLQQIKKTLAIAFFPIAGVFVYLASLSIYSLAYSGFSLPDFVQSGETGSLQLFIAFMLLAMGFIATLIYRARRNLKAKTHLLLILSGAIIFAFNLMNNGPIEEYMAVFIISFVLAVFFYLVFSKRVKHQRARVEIWPLAILVAIFALAYSIISVFRIYNFNAHAYDLGIFTQAFYQFSHFEFSNTVRDVSHLWGDHFHPILVPFSLLYRLIPSVYFLVILQALVVALGAVPIYLIALKKLKSSWAGLVLATAYLSFIGLAKAIEFDFHPITLATTAFLLVFYFYLLDKKWWYWLGLVVLLACQEDVAIFVAMLGIFIFVTNRQKRWMGALTFALGIMWFYVVTKLVIGALADGGYIYFAYSSLGETPTEAVKAIMISPLHAIRAMTNHASKMQTVLSAFSSFSFLIFFSPAFFILAVAMLGEGLWNDAMSRWSGFHYEAIVAPVLIISAIYAISQIMLFCRAKYRPALLTFLAMMVLSSSVCVALHRHTPLVRIFKLSFYKVSPEISALHQLIPKVPKNASVSAQHSVVPILAGRERIYEYPGCDPAKCHDVDYFILSTAGSLWPLEKQGMAAEIKAFLQGDDFRGEFGLYKREGTGFIFKKGHQISIEEKEQALSDWDNYMKSL